MEDIIKKQLVRHGKSLYILIEEKVIYKLGLKEGDTVQAVLSKTIGGKK